MNYADTDISRLEYSVVRLLSYYAIFRHPLTEKEILNRVNYRHLESQDLIRALQGLVEAGVVKEVQGHYALFDDKSSVERRKDGELRARKLLKIAHKMGKLIYTFPFVRAVFISGSLSKGVIHDDADIDYFIITKKNRLWIARTLLVIFKRLFLLGSKKYFCVNYFVDEDNLEIPDKNIFTATEVSTLIPLRGSKYCRAFMSENEWFKEFYPHLSGIEIPDQKPGIWKRLSILLEPLFIHRLGEKLDKYFMRKTYKRWMRMYDKGYTEEEFELAFRSRRGTSKNHNKNYQKRVLSRVEENVEQALEAIKLEPVNG